MLVNPQIPIPIYIAETIVSYINLNDDDKKKILVKMVSEIFKPKHLSEFHFNGISNIYNKRSVKFPLFQNKIFETLKKVVNILDLHISIEHIKAIESTPCCKKKNKEADLWIKFYHLMSNGLGANNFNEKLKDLQKELEFPELQKNELEEMINLYIENSESMTSLLSTEILHSYLKELTPYEIQTHFFYERVKKIYRETMFIDHNEKDSKAIFQSLPKDSRIIMEAIGEDLRYAIIDNALLSLENYHLTGEQKWYDQYLTWFKNIDERDSKEIEKLLLQWWEKELKNNKIDLSSFKSKIFSEQIEEHVKHCTENKINFRAPYIEHFLIEILRKGPISSNANLDRFCNEHIKGYFFEITDSESVIRGYLMGTIHLVPEELLKFRRVVRKAFNKSDAFMFENTNVYDFLNEILSKKNSKKPYDAKEFYRQYSQSKYIYTGHNNVVDGVVWKALDDTLMLSAFSQGKPLLMADTEESLKLAFQISCNPNMFSEEFIKKTDEEKEKDFIINAKALIKGYCKGNLENLKDKDKKVKPEKMTEYNKIVLADRNIIQCNNIDTYLCENPSKILFVSLGAGHLPSHKEFSGVLDLLKEKGWNLTQI